MRPSRFTEEQIIRILKKQETGAETAAAFTANVQPVVRDLQAAGVVTVRAIAEALNERGIWTARGGEWHGSTVRNSLGRNAR